MRVQRSAFGVKGGRRRKEPARRGAVKRKLHILTDVIGRPFALRLTPDNVSDVRAAEFLIGDLNGAKRLIADKGYDANAFRMSLRNVGAPPVIPGRSNRKRMISYDKDRYRERHLVENAFCRLKDFRRIATRYDKLGRNFFATAAIAIVVAFWV